MERCLRLASAAFLAVVIQGGQAAPAAPETGADAQATRLRFVMPRAAATSAGVYSESGRLVRTLWRSEVIAQGPQERAWDQRDDQGTVVPAGSYEFLILHHRIDYVWEGVVGNNSSTFTGPQVHKAFLPPTSITIDGDSAFYAVGYNEGQPGIHGFRLADPGLDTLPLPSTEPFVGRSMLAVDQARLYWANTGGFSKSSFIGAIDRGIRAPVQFTAGRNICLNRVQNSQNCYPDQDYKGVIDVQTDPVEVPTGLAVQRNGRVLAIAHGGRNLIRLFDKNTGEPLGEFSVPLAAKALNQLAMSAAGDLWVISRRQVLRFTDLERAPKVIATIEGLDQPLALGAHPDNDEVLWVADGGASQQLKQFMRNGRPGAVIGRAGGYVSDPAVQPDKLCFRAAQGAGQTAVGVAIDGSIWTVDHCNNRMLRFRPTPAGPWVSDAQVAYLPHSYCATVDHRNPRRVFANFLEFEVDGTKPLKPGNRSWRLVRNWLAGMPSALVDERSANSGFGGLTSVETLSNGRTYGMVQVQGRQVIVELPPSGPLRVVRTLAAPMPRTTAKVLYENGDLGYALTGSSTQTVLRLPLTGFDEAGDPVWAREPVRLVSVPLQSGSPHYRGAFSGILPPRFPVTASGQVVFFDQAVDGNEGFHLGAARQGSSEWSWRASPTGPLDGKGSFQTKAIDGSLQYGGNAVWAEGRHIVYGYHGESFKDLQTGKIGQANQFMHFDESGLFLGQFGVLSSRATIPAQAGLSGNALSPTLVRDGTKLFVYHNDEHAHGGVHRWRVDGADDIGELKGRGALGAVVILR